MGFSKCSRCGNTERLTNPSNPMANFYHKNKEKIEKLVKEGLVADTLIMAKLLNESCSILQGWVEIARDAKIASIQKGATLEFLARKRDLINDITE